MEWIARFGLCLGSRLLRRGPRLLHLPGRRLLRCFLRWSYLASTRVSLFAMQAFFEFSVQTAFACALTFQLKARLKLGVLGRCRTKAQETMRDNRLLADCHPLCRAAFRRRALRHGPSRSSQHSAIQTRTPPALSPQDLSLLGGPLKRPM